MIQLLAVIFLYFGSICSFPRKWTQQKLLVKESPTVRWKRFGNPEQGGPEWWAGILDVCSFLAVLPLSQRSAALNADTMAWHGFVLLLRTGGHHRGLSNSLFVVGHFDSISEDGIIQQARVSPAPAVPSPSTGPTPIPLKQGLPTTEPPALVLRKVNIKHQKKIFSNSWNRSWATDDNDRSIAVYRC